ncbi:MAG: NADH-quinone oxidoreductase subunit NuoE [Anaerolineaceae bacterium]|nr:NADH-quinone oxidoreductase subunit NuoE [Anaerolineaceae bacterium]
MTIEPQNGKAVVEAVNAAIERYGAERSELIPILNDVNRKIGFLPPEALEEISRRVNLPKSQLFSVATFYNMLSTKPRGRHVIKFCESAPCHVAGGREVWRALQEELNLKPGGTTPDGKWTLVTTSCLGVCGVGPVMSIDDDIHGSLTVEQVHEILGRYS